MCGISQIRPAAPRVLPNAESRGCVGVGIGVAVGIGVEVADGVGMNRSDSVAI